MHARLICATAVALLVALAGCARLVGDAAPPPSPGATTLRPGENLASADARAVVIGRIQRVEPGTPGPRGSPTVALYRVEDGQWLGALALDADGRFYWLLPRGTYLIARYDDRPSHAVSPRAAFQAASDGTVVYTGTLRLEVDPRTDTVQAEVRDDFDQAGALLEARNRGLGRPIVNRLMVRDGRFDPALARPALVEALRAEGLPVLVPAP